MSTNISTTTAAVKTMRWIARIISIPWAFWALFWTLFITGHVCPRNPSMWAIVIPVMVIAFAMYLGSAIIAGVWGKEAFGGSLLIVDGLLLIVLFAALMHFTGLDSISRLDIFDVIGLLTIVLPPLVAGSLFLACHRKSH